MNEKEIEHHEQAVGFTERLYDELINRGIKLKPRRYVRGFASYYGYSDLNDLWIDLDNKDKDSVIISSLMCGGDEEEPYFLSIYTSQSHGKDYNERFKVFDLEKIIDDIFTFLDIHPKVHYEQLSLF